MPVTTCSNLQDAGPLSLNMTFSTLLEMLHYRVGSALEQGMVGPVKMLKFSTEKFIPKTLVEENK